MKSQKRLLAWSDTPTIATGYGKISKYVLKALVSELGYQIDQVGVSHFGEFYDQTEYPWRIASAVARDSRDPSGKTLFLNTLKYGDYDYVWMQLDIQHLFSIASQLRDIKAHFEANKQKFPKIIYHVPVDSDLYESNRIDFEVCDILVPYTNYGKDQIVQYAPVMKDRIHPIGCGYDPNVLLRLSDTARRLFRKSYFGLEDDSTFLIININRNSTRKMLTHVLKIFSIFKQNRPNSKLYLHTDPRERASGIALDLAATELGLRIPEDVFFPEDFSTTKPRSEATLTAIYNAADCFFTAAFGEGWGLTQTDAMVVGVPVVAPDNSVFPEILGDGRGYLYPCRESIWFHSIGYRPVPRIEDALTSLYECHDDFNESRAKGKCERQDVMLAEAEKWISNYTIEKVQARWVGLFKKLDTEG